MYAQVLHECKPVTEKPLVLTEMDKPDAAAGDVLIKVHACGICRTDLHVVEGELDPKGYDLPVIPGHQVVGTIESAPEGSQFRPGPLVLFVTGTGIAGPESNHREGTDQPVRQLHARAPASYPESVSDHGQCGMDQGKPCPEDGRQLEPFSIQRG